MNKSKIRIIEASVLAILLFFIIIEISIVKKESSKPNAIQLESTSDVENPVEEVEDIVEAKEIPLIIPTVIETKKSVDEIMQTKDPVKIGRYTHFYQNQFADIVWPGGNNPPDKQTLAFNGCSITSLSDVLTNFGMDASPEEITNYLNSLPDNYHKEEGGPRKEMFHDVAEYYGFSGKITSIESDDLEKVYICLNDGGMVISLQGPGEFTLNGHYIVICDLNEQNEVLVLDSNIHNREKEEIKDFRYSLNEIAENCNKWILFSN